MVMLRKGENAVISNLSVQAVLTWTSGSGIPDVDISALLLTDRGKVRSDDDFVFYNQAVHCSGAVRHLGKSVRGRLGQDGIAVDLARVEPQIQTVVIGASADGGTFGAVPGLQIRIIDASSQTELAQFAMTADTETAFVCCELYRRNNQWKVRAVGQGYAAGLAGLATDYGISVDDEPAPAPQRVPAVAPASPAVPALSPTPIPATHGVVNLDKGRVNLTKNQRVLLVKTGAPALTRVRMGLGWDPARRGENIDLDASAIAFDASGHKLKIVWFMHLHEFGGALYHTGDNLTGAGEGDDEQIIVELNKLPERVAALVFTINSFRGQKFTEISRAYCRLVDDVTGTELVRFDLSDSQPRTGVLMTALIRLTQGPWEMRACGEFHDGRTVKALIRPAAEFLARG